MMTSCMICLIVAWVQQQKQHSFFLHQKSPLFLDSILSGVVVVVICVVSTSSSKLSPLCSVYNFFFPFFAFVDPFILLLLF